MKPKIFMKEECVFQQGEIDKTIYILLSGSANIYIRKKELIPVKKLISKTSI